MGGGVSTIKSFGFRIKNAKITFNEESYHICDTPDLSPSFKECVEIIRSPKLENQNKGSQRLRMETQDDSDTILLCGDTLADRLDAESLKELPAFVDTNFKVSRVHVDLASRNWRDVKTGTDVFMNQNKHTSGGNLFCEEFYSRLFLLLPEVKCLYRKDKLGSQGRALIRIITQSLALLSRPGDLIHLLEVLADRHIIYGVTEPSHFGAFGNCMVETLQYCSGTNWNEDIECAWEEVYSLFLLVMVPRIMKGTKKLQTEESPLISSKYNNHTV